MIFSLLFPYIFHNIFYRSNALLSISYMHIKAQFEKK